MAAPDDPRRAIRRLYRGVDGYEIPRAEERTVRSTKGSPTYGEMTPGGVARLLEYLALDSSDVFYDLGSGSGKVVLQAAMTAPARKCVGVELSVTRLSFARAALRAARREKLLVARSCAFRRQNILETYLSDATVVYTCSTAFSLKFMELVADKVATIKRGVIFVSLQDLEPRGGFEHIDTLRLDMTWKRRSGVYVYAVG